MRRASALFISLLLAACAAPWTPTGARSHDALKDGAEIVTLERGAGASRERLARIRWQGEDADASSVEDLLPFVRPIETAEAAIAYSELVRVLGVADAGARGFAVRADGSLTGPGGSGRYSVADAAAWGVDFLPTARPYAGGFEVSRVVLLPPVQHPHLERVFSPWKLVLVREVVFADGRIRATDERTLTNGSDAARFAGP